MPNSSFELFDQDKPILLFGRDGQVGRALQTCLKDLKIRAVFLGREECDFSNTQSISQVLNEYRPQVIINTAAYTDVDKAEIEPDLAFAINAKAPEMLAHYVANISRGIFVHYSTDYVFADTKQTDYLETDMPGPVKQLCVYGQSKLAGECAIKEAFHVAHDRHYSKYQDKFSRYFILRTSWVYGDGDNFIRTMLRLAADRSQLKVVCDQIGTPTSAQWLAEISIHIARSRVESGIYHAVPDGETSWFRLAIFAITLAKSLGKDIEVELDNIISIPAADYLSHANRPYNSRLCNAKLKKTLADMAFICRYPCWQEQVEAYVKKIMATSLKK